MFFELCWKNNVKKQAIYINKSSVRLQLLDAVLARLNFICEGIQGDWYVNG